MKVEEVIVAEAIKGIVSISVDIIKKSSQALFNKLKNEEKIFLAKLDKSITSYIENLFRRFGYMKVLGMHEAVLLKDILISVQLLSEENINSYRSLEELEKKFVKEGNRSFQITDKNSHDGIKVVNENKYLMVLGPPGSGKSTFLKKVAFEALDYAKLTELNKYIPVIIELKRLEKDISIIDFIEKEFSICHFPDSKEFVEYSLKQGRLVLILDGLDEINEGFEIDAFNELKDFIDKYNQCKYVISSRNLAYKGDFKQFKDVEIANFNNEQIKSFADRWFLSKKQSQLAEDFKKKLFSSDYKSTKELAQTPLLLTLLCLVFSSQQDFPRNRATLYKDAIDVLLKEWNAEKRIYRNPIYADMTLPFEEMLLSQIAYEFFTTNAYFFEKKDLASKISFIIEDNLNSPKYLDGEEILNAISLQQGILIERAKNIYTFSHLTIHEYFTAKYIDDNNLLEENINNFITYPRWREVFLLLSGMSKTGSDKILTSINSQIQNDLTTYPSINKLLKAGNYENELDTRLFVLIIKLSFLFPNNSDFSSTHRSSINDLNIENSLAIIIRDLELTNSYNLLASYIMDFRLHIEDQFLAILSVLKDNRNSSPFIEKVFKIFENNKQSVNKENLIIEIAAASQIGQNEISFIGLKNYFEKIIFLILCKKASIKVSRSVWKGIEENLFLGT